MYNSKKLIKLTQRIYIRFVPVYAEPEYYICWFLYMVHHKMNPDMFLYLAQQIVKRKIKVYKIHLQTNGTIKNNEVKQALITLSDYFESAKKQSWMEDIKKFETEKQIVFYNAYNCCVTLLSLR